MSKATLLVLGSIGLCGFVLTLLILTHGQAFPLLTPHGSVGLSERDLMLRALYLMLIVVIPVMLLAIFIGWHYRESNTKAAYTPNWEHSKMEELIWWSIPLEIVLVLAALTWTSTHELDPGRALTSTEPPLTVQVVALPWKWLFIYPQEGVASVNELALPTHRPIRFEITADAPMNSFWIPALGGQMYAMTGMTTVLNLETDEPGVYPGRSANYSGEGFAQMQFSTKAMSADDFSSWVASARTSPDQLSRETYTELARPSDAGPVHYYGSMTMTFGDIVATYMPLGSMHH